MLVTWLIIIYTLIAGFVWGRSFTIIRVDLSEGCSEVDNFFVIDFCMTFLFGVFWWVMIIALIVDKDFRKTFKEWL